MSMNNNVFHRLEKEVKESKIIIENSWIRIDNYAENDKP